HPAAAERLFAHKVESVEAGQHVASHFPLDQMPKILRNARLRHLGGNNRNVFRPPRHDPDVADVAFVPASYISELDQGNLNSVIRRAALRWRGNVSRIAG